MSRSDQVTPENESTGQSAGVGLVCAFGEFHLDESARRLSRGEVRVRIQNKPLDVLIYLIKNRSRMVTREELLEQYWPRAVNDESLTRCISTLRKLLGDVREPARYIETQWGQGYRFIASPKPDPLVKKKLPILTRNRVIAVAIVLTVMAVAGVVRIFFSTSLSGIDRIAVLPIIASADDAVAASALTDHLIRTVSRIDGILVTARGSASQFDAGDDPREVGRRLGVDAVLISDLERSDGSAVLSSQLVSATDGTLLWSFTGQPSKTSTDEEQIHQLARSVSRRLWANLQLRDQTKQVNPVAYRHYLRGRYFWNQRSEVGLAAAIEEYDQALKLEPLYVDALIGLADSWLLMPLYSATAPMNAIPKARAAAQMALERDPLEARAHAVLGVISMQYDWQWDLAESHLRRALTLNPNDATTEQWLGELHCYRRDFPRCRRHLTAAAGLDPLSPVLRMLQGSPDLYAGNYQAAAEAYQQALNELPNFVFPRLPLGHAYVGQGSWDRAIAEYEAALPDLGMAIVAGPLIFALARSGETERAVTLLDDLEQLSRSRYVPPTKLAMAYLALGEKELALAWLRRALEVHDDRLAYLAVDPVFFELHSDPEFREIAGQVKLLAVLP